jgi:hypothetical protein
MLASKAAPGVDHAMLTGILRAKLSKMPHNPMATPTAIKPDVAWACVAPMASKPFTTTANELAKPTKDAIAPAAQACGEGPNRVGVAASIRTRREFARQTF